MGFVSRLYNLVRGGLSNWLGGREQKNPAAVYEAAINERLEQYVKLRQAAAGVLYMRSKLAREVEMKTAALRGLARELEYAVDHDQDDVALALIGRRDVLSAEVARVTEELAELNREAEAAKKNLVAFQGEVARLREEKVRMLAKLANAKARLRLQETIKGISPDADIRALEEVRAHVERLVAEAQVSREVNDVELEKKLEGIREAEASNAARAQLDELKRVRKRSLVPLDLGEKTEKARATNGAAAM
ncbi:PspA/IM30 family protein [Candidatus Binatia bacterium]|jgi:phage shock protein A|nr:PspA/IM30 family protein [Candidatus Binatia bacterium]